MNLLIAVVTAAVSVVPGGTLGQQPVRQNQERPRPAQDRARERAADRASQDRRDNREEQTEKISRTVKIGDAGELDLSNLSGDIIVNRGGGGSVQIEAVKIARGRTIEEARKMLAEVRVDIVERGARAEVRAIYPRRDDAMRNGRNVNVSVQYTVTMPEKAKLSARTLSGDVRVTDIKGDVNVASMSGNVGVYNGARVMSVKSRSGRVEIANLQSEIALEAETLSGELVVRQSRVARMALGTISGKLMIEGVECSRIDAQTLSGDITFTSRLTRDGRYELNSHSGSIHISPSGNTGFELDANSFSGDIRSEITLKDQRQDGAESPRRGPGGRHRSLRGIFGDGSARLDVTTFSGTVVIGGKK